MAILTRCCASRARPYTYYGCTCCGYTYYGYSYYGYTYYGYTHQVPRFENTIMRHKSFNQKEVSTVLKLVFFQVRELDPGPGPGL